MGKEGAELTLAHGDLNGDVTGDGAVTQDDIDIILANMGLEGADLTMADGDLNGDGVVDALDLAIALDHLGTQRFDVEWNDGVPRPFSVAGPMPPTWRLPPPFWTPVCTDDPWSLCCCPCGVACGEHQCECGGCCDGLGTGDPCFDGGPCHHDCEDRWCDPACGGGHGECHPQCSGSECNDACDHFDPCNEECGDDGDGGSYGPCHPDCEEDGGGPCGENCDERVCNPECEDDEGNPYVPCHPECEALFIGAGGCETPCDELCNPECGGDPCAPECAGSGFDCGPCDVDPCGATCLKPCPCEPGETGCCDDDPDPDPEEETPIVCVGVERTFCAPVCPEEVCLAECDPEPWTWGGGPGLEFVGDDNEGQCVTVIFTEAGVISISATNDCCSAKNEVIAMDVRLDAVTFGGDKFHAVARDTTGAAYERRHWMSARARAEKQVCSQFPDECCDGEWDAEFCDPLVDDLLEDLEDRRHPVAYTRISDGNMHHMMIRNEHAAPNLTIPETILHIDTGSWHVGEEGIVVKKVVARDSNGNELGTWQADDDDDEGEPVNSPIPLEEIDYGNLGENDKFPPHKFIPTMNIELNDDGGGELPNTIAYHEGMTTEWTIEINGREITTVCGAMRSENTLYVTLENPQVSPLYHTVVDIACRRAAGMGEPFTDEAIVGEIWGEFATRAVRRVEDDAPLHYYGSWHIGNTALADLLNEPGGGDGQCYTWAELLIACLRVHGLNGSPVTFTAENGGVIPPQGAESRFLVRTWDFHGPPSGEGEFNYVNMATSLLPFDSSSYQWASSEVTAQNGVAAQNTGNPLSLFNNHQVVWFNGRFYDPSYGTGPFDSFVELYIASTAGHGYVIFSGLLWEFRFLKNPLAP